MANDQWNSEHYDQLKVSIKKGLREPFKKFCEDNGKTMAGVIEDFISSELSFVSTNEFQYDTTFNFPVDIKQYDSFIVTCGSVRKAHNKLRQLLSACYGDNDAYNSFLKFMDKAFFAHCLFTTKEDLIQIWRANEIKNSQKQKDKIEEIIDWLEDIEEKLSEDNAEEYISDAISSLEQALYEI